MYMYINIYYSSHAVQYVDETLTMKVQEIRMKYKYDMICLQEI